MTTEPYRYYISYVCERFGGVAHGWSELLLAGPIRTGEDIKRVISALIEDNPDLSKVTILNFQRFDT